MRPLGLRRAGHDRLHAELFQGPSNLRGKLVTGQSALRRSSDRRSAARWSAGRDTGPAGFRVSPPRCAAGAGIQQCFPARPGSAPRPLYPWRRRPDPAASTRVHAAPVKRASCRRSAAACLPARGGHAGSGSAAACASAASVSTHCVECAAPSSGSRQGLLAGAASRSGGCLLEPAYLPLANSMTRCATVMLVRLAGARPWLPGKTQAGLSAWKHCFIRLTCRSLRPSASAASRTPIRPATAFPITTIFCNCFRLKSTPYFTFRGDRIAEQLGGTESLNNYSAARDSLTVWRSFGKLKCLLASNRSSLSR